MNVIVEFASGKRYYIILVLDHKSLKGNCEIENVFDLYNYYYCIYLCISRLRV